MIKFLKDLFSIVENRVSALVLTFVPTVVVTLISVFVFRDIPTNLLTLDLVYITVISGVNVLPYFTKKPIEEEVKEESKVIENGE